MIKRTRLQPSRLTVGCLELKHFYSVSLKKKELHNSWFSAVWESLQTHMLCICLGFFFCPRISQQHKDLHGKENCQVCLLFSLTNRSLCSPEIQTGSNRKGNGSGGCRETLHLARWTGRLYSDPRRRLWNGFSVAVVVGWEGPHPFSWPLLWRC